MKKVEIMGKPKSYIGLIKTQYDKSFLYNNSCSHPFLPITMVRNSFTFILT